MNKEITREPKTSQFKLAMPETDETSQVLRVVRQGLRADPPEIRFVARDLRLPQL